MGALEYIIGSVLIVFSLLIIVVVLLQEGRQANVGVISGAADSFMDKGAARTLDQKLSKWTKVIAIAFFIVVLVGMLMTNFAGEEQANSVPNEGATNDAELDFSDSDADKKDEDKEEEADKKEEADHDHDHDHE